MWILKTEGREKAFDDELKAELAIIRLFNKQGWTWTEYDQRHFRKGIKFEDGNGKFFCQLIKKENKENEEENKVSRELERNGQYIQPSLFES